MFLRTNFMKQLLVFRTFRFQDFRIKVRIDAKFNKTRKTVLITYH